MTPLDLLSACEQVYDAPAIVSASGRDAASVTVAADGSVVVAFRGTLTEGKTAIEDWLQDLNAKLILADGFAGRVHEGFLHALNSVWDAVFDALESSTRAGHDANPLPWSRTIYLTGHSKGGAVAQLAGVRLAALKPKVVTFAAPMTGDLAFANEYPEAVSVTRYESFKDLVPLLPPHLLGYREVGEAVPDVYMPLRQRQLRIGRTIAEGDWAALEDAHHLSSYRSWIGRDDDRGPAVQQRAA